MEDDSADLLHNNAFDDDWNIPSLSFPKIDEDALGLSGAVVQPQDDSDTEKTTVVPESLTFEGAAEPSRSAIEDGGEMADLEKIAEDDPEHDPLKTVPVPPKKPLPIKKIALGVIIAVVVIALVVAGVFVVRSKNEDKSQGKRDAIAMCEKAQSKYTKASKALESAMQKAAGLQKLTKDQVADGNVLTKLNKSVEQGEQLSSSNITTECSASLAQTVLESRANNMNSHSGDMQKQADAVASAVKTVETSKKTLETKNARSSLEQAISAARTLLDNSNGQVADEATRNALSQAIDAAQKLIDGKSSDAQAMRNAVKAISTATDSVNASIQAAQAVAAQTNSQNNSQDNSWGNSWGSQYPYGYYDNGGNHTTSGVPAGTTGGGTGGTGGQQDNSGDNGDSDNGASGGNQNGSGAATNPSDNNGTDSNTEN